MSFLKNLYAKNDWTQLFQNQGSGAYQRQKRWFQIELNFWKLTGLWLSKFHILRKQNCIFKVKLKAALLQKDTKSTFYLISGSLPMQKQANWFAVE